MDVELRNQGDSETKVPLVSVVIGVHNGGVELKPTIQSVLDQEGVDFEVIVVNDGSTDGTKAILETMAASDSRLQVFHQPSNSGLTKALIRGCREARGKYIARQDNGDISLPGRLKTQTSCLEQDLAIVLSSCWTRIVGPENEYLGCNCPSDPPEAATQKLLAGLSGVTHHGAVMFRADAYHAAGGYRSEFYFAQDLDLWYRLLNFGQLAFLTSILYQIKVTPQCLSSRYRDQQIALAAIIRQLAKCVSQGANETELLVQASQIRPENCKVSKTVGTASGEYWIASMLIRQADPRASKYLRSVVRQRPLFLRGWLGFIRLAGSRVRKSIHYLLGNKPHEASSGF